MLVTHSRSRQNLQATASQSKQAARHDRSSRVALICGVVQNGNPVAYLSVMPFNICSSLLVRYCAVSASPQRIRKPYFKYSFLLSAWMADLELEHTKWMTGTREKGLTTTSTNHHNHPLPPYGLSFHFYFSSLSSLSSCGSSLAAHQHTQAFASSMLYRTSKNTCPQNSK